jgi:DNA-binding transcriptional MerR regulator
VTPRRGTGNQRLYDSADIARLKRAAKMRAANLRLSEVKVALAVTSGTTAWNDAEGLGLLRLLLQRIGAQLAAAEELAAAIASRIARGPRPSPVLASAEAARHLNEARVGVSRPIEPRGAEALMVKRKKTEPKVDLQKFAVKAASTRAGLTLLPKDSFRQLDERQKRTAALEAELADAKSRVEISDRAGLRCADDLETTMKRERELRQRIEDLEAERAHSDGELASGELDLKTRDAEIEFWMEDSDYYRGRLLDHARNRAIAAEKAKRDATRLTERGKTYDSWADNAELHETVAQDLAARRESRT